MKNFNHDFRMERVEWLNRLSFCSRSLNQAWVRELTQLVQNGRHDESVLWSSLNTKQIWGGAGSLANEALNGNPGLPEAQWQQAVWLLRADMIQLGELLQSHGQAYPDSWSGLPAFHNGNTANA